MAPTNIDLMTPAVQYTSPESRFHPSLAARQRLNVFLFIFHFRRSLDNEWRYNLWLHTPFIVSYQRLFWQEKTSRFPTGKLSGNTNSAMTNETIFLYWPIIPYLHT